MTLRLPVCRSTLKSRHSGFLWNISLNFCQVVSGNQSAAAISMPTILVQALLATQVP